MKIEKSFTIDRPIDIVWEAFGDVRLVASCLPGASITEDLGEGKHKGQFAIKLGPMSASFGGDVAIDRKRESWTAVVSGKGSDPRSSSRANGSMTYRLSGGDGGGPTRVDVVSEINLAGALAQFGKAGVISEVAGRLTDAFVRNFEEKLALARAREVEHSGMAAGTIPAADAKTPEANAAAPQALDAGNLLWSVLKDRVVALFRRLLGRAA